MVETRVTVGGDFERRKNKNAYPGVQTFYLGETLAAICINYVNWQLSSFPGQHPQLPFAARARSNKRPFTAKPKTNFVSFSHCYTNFSWAAIHTQQLLQTWRGERRLTGALNGKCWARFCDLYLSIRDKILAGPCGHRNVVCQRNTLRGYKLSSASIRILRERKRGERRHI